MSNVLRKRLKDSGALKSAVSAHLKKVDSELVVRALKLLPFKTKLRFCFGILISRR